VRSGAARRAAVSTARKHLRRPRLAALAWLWPFPWNWLLGWAVAVALVVGSRLLAESILAAARAKAAEAEVAAATAAAGASSGNGWREATSLALANLAVLAYVRRGRAPFVRAVGEATSLKQAGTTALRLRKLDLAAQQYTAGARRAASIRSDGWWLNGGACRLLDEVR